MSVPYLCGGVFFWILARHLNSNTNERSLLRRLLVACSMKEDNQQTQNLDKDTSFKTYTSNFKRCKEPLFSNNKFMKYSDHINDFIKDFDKKEKSKALESTISIVTDCLDNNYNKIAHKLLELIASDESISGDVEFCITHDFKPIKKNELETLNSICIETLILGIWTYIVINRHDKNQSGIETINEWSDGKKYTQKTLNHTFTDQFNHVIVYRYGDRESYLPTSQETINEIESVGLSDISELELSDNDLENITISKSVKEESPDKSSDMLVDSDKKLLEEFMTDISSIRRVIRSINKSSKLSPQMIIDISFFLMKWKTEGKYHNFINDTLVKDTSELLNYLTEFNNVFRWQPSGNTAHRQDLLDSLNSIFISRYFISNDAFFHS